MLKKAFLIILSSFVLFGCSLSVRKSSVEIMSNPQATVFINGKEMGMTPYRNNQLKPGEIDLRLVGEKQTLNKKIRLVNNVNTVVDWTFGESEEESGGYVLSMEELGDKKITGLLVNSAPEKASILIDDELKGQAPTKLSIESDSDQKITLMFPSYKNIDVFVKSIKGYQLIIDAKLRVEKQNISEMEEIESTGEQIEMATILSTETGFLRVRAEASSNGKEIAKVKPGEKYQVKSKTDKWVEIKINENTSGFVSATYVEISLEQSQ